MFQVLCKAAGDFGDLQEVCIPSLEESVGISLVEGGMMGRVF